VVRRKNAALTREAYTSIQPEESPPGGQERECSFNTCLFFSFIPNKVLVDGGETPKQRTKSLIQELLKKNDLEEVRLKHCILFLNVKIILSF